jgi:N-acetylglucosaminyldiphosphoundecaprenol N-acetyl-beta-D-mannosaminyltransferase
VGTVLAVEPGLAQALDDVRVVGSCRVCEPTRETEIVNRARFDVIDADKCVRRCRGFVKCGASHVIHFLSVHPTVAARQVRGYAALLNAADLVLPDGAPIAAIMRLRNRSARRLTGTDGLLRLCGDCDSPALRHYFIGGSSGQVAEALIRRLKEIHPHVVIAGFEVPPFRPYTAAEVDALVAVIRNSDADVVWIAIGAPKQELLAHRLRAAAAAPVIATVGAAFDFVAGTKTRAPRWMQTIGLEWVFRLVREPRRLWRRYLVGNTLFFCGLARDALSRMPSSRARRAGIE